LSDYLFGSEYQEQPYFVFYGFVINDINGANRWQTFIESCLIKNENGIEKIAYLSTSALAEMVSPNKIFGNKLCDGAIVNGWDQAMMLRSGAGLYHPFRLKKSEGRHRTVACSEGGVYSSVYAPKTEVKFITFKELYKLLCSAPKQRDNFIYMLVSWKSDQNTQYSIICPCRYINFPNPNIDVDTAAIIWPNKPTEEYIQPISGSVLVEYRQRYHKAYVASHVTKTGMLHTELCIQDSISYFDTKRGISSKAMKIMKLLTAPLSYFLMTDEYHKVLSIKAECSFFVY